VFEDSIDDVSIGNFGDGPHPRAALWTAKGIDGETPPKELCPIQPWPVCEQLATEEPFEVACGYHVELGQELQFSGGRQALG